MIGILNAHHLDSPPGPHYAEYTKHLIDFASKAFDGAPVRNFNIALGDWPSNTDECKVWIISGSAKAAYDNDPWITQLKQLIVDIDQQKRKLIGICFGHQVIASALGGEVIKSPMGWGVGSLKFKILDQQPWMTPALAEATLLFSHQDQVIKLPPRARLLATDAFCEIQMFQVENHILTMQGHPEYTPEYLKDRMMSRRALIPPETLQKAVESLVHHRDFGTIGQWIKNFAAAK